MGGTRFSAAAWRNARMAAVELLVNVGLPLAIYSAAERPLGEVHALLASSAPPIAWSLLAFARRRRVDAISLLSIAGIALSVLAFLGGGSVQLLQLREKMVTGAVGVAFLASAAIGRPLIYEAAKAGMARRSATEIADFEASVDPRMLRRATRLMTVVWGVGLLADVAASCALVFAVPIRVYLVLNPLLGYATLGTLGVWTFLHARRHGLNGRRRAGVPAPSGEG